MLPVAADIDPLFGCAYSQMEDNKRSIPSLVDGFKPSQRKVLFSCFKRNLKKEIKVRLWNVHNDRRRVTAAVVPARFLFSYDS